jgi:uncharacterized protein YhaN
MDPARERAASLIQKRSTKEQLDERAAEMRQKSTSLSKRDAAIRLWRRRREAKAGTRFDLYTEQPE